MAILDTVSGAIGRFAATVRGQFPPQALAETVPSLTNGWFYGGGGLDLVGKHVAYGQLYRSQPGVSALVDKRANATARLSLNVWDTTPATGKVKETDSPLARLLADPTAGEMSRFAFWRWVSSTYDIHGEAFVYKVRDDAGNVKALYPMTPQRTVVRRDQIGNVEYIFTLGVASAGLLKAPESDVIAFRRYNPDTVMRGMSRLEPLRSTLASEDAARRATLSFWQRGARPGTIVEHPATLSPNALDKLRTAFSAKYAGPDLVGSTAVLDEGMKLQIVQLNMEEMQYVETRRLNMQECCMVYDVPPPVVHILDHATFSNITEQMRSMYRDTMAPHLEDLESVVATDLVPEFYPNGGHEVTFALDEVLRGDFETRATAVVGLVSNGVMKPAEARPLFDLPDAGPVADALYANQAMQPLGMPVIRETVDAGSEPKTPEQIAAEAAQADAAAPVKTYKASHVVRSTVGRIQTKESRAAMREAAVKPMQKAVAGQMGAQADAIQGSWDTYGDLPDDVDPEDLAGDLYDTEEWEPDLADALRDPSEATVTAFASKMATKLGGTFDPGMVQNWLDASCAGAAKAIVATTAASLAVEIGKAIASGDDPKQAITDALSSFVDNLTGARVDEIADTRTDALANFGEKEGATQAGGGTKTWVVQSPNPRPSHAAMDGESVGIDEDFSNGMSYPGDPSADVSEVAGCTCVLDYA